MDSPLINNAATILDDSNRTTPQRAAVNLVGHVRKANASASTGPTISDDAYARAQRTVEQRLKRMAKPSGRPARPIPDSERVVELAR